MAYASPTRSKPIAPAPTRSAKGRSGVATCVAGTRPSFVGLSPRLDAVTFTHPSGIQAKLKVGEPDDKFEREADRVADQVMRIPDPRLTGPFSPSGTAPAHGIQRLCSECEEEARRQPIEEEEEELQMKPRSGATPEISPGLQAQVSGLRGGGEPLRPSVRGFFEPRFGVDFSQVRIHKGHTAADAAQSINARAFTVGRDVVFGLGEYAPATAKGQSLLAHELAHVVQQRGRLEPVGRGISLSGAENPRIVINNRKEESVQMAACSHPPGLDLSKVTAPRIAEEGEDPPGRTGYTRYVHRYEEKKNASTYGLFCECVDAVNYRIEMYDIPLWPQEWVKVHMSTARQCCSTHEGADVNQACSGIPGSFEFTDTFENDKMYLNDPSGMSDRDLLSDVGSAASILGTVLTVIGMAAVAAPGPP